MPLLHEAVEKKKFDVRMIDRNVVRGVITAADAENSVKALPDDAENASYVNVDALVDDSQGDGANNHH